LGSCLMVELNFVHTLVYIVFTSLCSLFQFTVNGVLCWAGMLHGIRWIPSFSTAISMYLNYTKTSMDCHMAFTIICCAHLGFIF
jgi:hypothetical protein